MRLIVKRRSIGDLFIGGRSDGNVQLVSDVVKEDRRVTIRAISETLNLSYGTVQRILTEDLSMKRVSARWVPRLLKENEMSARVRESERFLRRWRKEGEAFLRRIITVDETWVYLYDPESKLQSSQWKSTDSPPPKKARVSRTTKKHMFVVFFDMDGVVLSHAVPQGQAINASYYSKVLSRDLMTALRKKRRHIYDNLSNCIIHHDNATPHTAMETVVTIELLGMEKLPHPPYSPDLAPCDFALFPHLKNELRGTHFEDLQHLRQACNEVFSLLPREWFADVFQKWVKRHQRCVEHQGRYFEKE